jgi:outer membrane lipoprotein-sorting protein
MNTKRTALGVAVTGTAAGIVGLVVMALPASAGGTPPPLPPISAEALVQSVLSTHVPAMSGTVSVKENLGLPIPILPSGGSDGVAARVYSDGTGKGRISLTKQMSETTIVEDGSTLWIWDSADKSVRKMPHDAAAKPAPSTQELADPASAAQKIVSAIQEDSTVAVDGTAQVAGRSAYQLVLTPKPTEKTLLREVRVAIDSELRMPLRLEVLGNGQADPALRIAFTEFSPGAQDASLFQFSPPAGAKVTEAKPGDQKPDPKAAQDLLTQINPQVVGKGWDTVVVGKVPANLLSGAMPGQNGRSDRGNQPDVTSLLRTFAKQVNGSFGTGWVVSTKVGTALFTADGRAALGAVPEQVLIDAIGQVK